MAKRTGFLSTKNIIFYLFTIAVIVVIATHFVELRKLKELIHHVNGWWLIAALLAQAGTYFGNGFVFRVFLRVYKKGKLGLSVFDFFSIALVTVFVKQVIPSGGISGSGFTFRELTRRGVEPDKAYLSVIMDILSFYVAIFIVLISVPVIAFIYLPHVSKAVIYTVIGGFVFFSILTAAITLIARKSSLQKLKTWLSKLPLIGKKIAQKDFSIVGVSEKDYDGSVWNAFFTNWRASGQAVLWQLVVLLLDALTIFALVRGLGIGTHFVLVYFSFILTTIVTSIPVSPGNLLVYEGAMTFFYTLVGIPFEAAAVITLLYRALSFWLPMPVGLVLYRYMSRQHDQERQPDTALSAPQ